MVVGAALPSRDLGVYRRGYEAGFGAASAVFRAVLEQKEREHEAGWERLIARFEGGR